MGMKPGNVTPKLFQMRFRLGATLFQVCFLNICGFTQVFGLLLCAMIKLSNRGPTLYLAQDLLTGSKSSYANAEQLWELLQHFHLGGSHQ